MPHRALGLHYSTIGYNHVGKVAVMQGIEAGTRRRAAALLDTAIGEPGTVAIGFAGPAIGLQSQGDSQSPHRAVTSGARFEGIDSVKAKYSRVHEINRTGSMLDNIIYFNIALEKELVHAERCWKSLLERSQRDRDPAGRHTSCFQIPDRAAAHDAAAGVSRTRGERANCVT